MRLDLIRRPRRLRQSGAIRELVAETRLAPSDLVLPVFFHRGGDDQPVSSMPGVVRHGVDSLLEKCRRAFAAGIRCVAVFPVIDPSLKDAEGSHAFSDGNILFSAIRRIHREVPGLMVMADVALDPYTSHGHDGLLTPDGTDVDNDATVEALVRLAVAEARAGAAIVGPSDMMDGRVGAIRAGLDGAGFSNCIVLSYAAKFASSYYGPFRDAVGSRVGAGGINKATYQLGPGNVREALNELLLDEEEGADIVMVKPAGPYLDIIRAAREQTNLPVAAYQVSGEYAQIHAAAAAGWLDYARCRDESLIAIKRAGADLILTYFALEVAESLR